MKSIILILVVVALANAAPKPTKLKFRNLYKEPVASKIKPHIIGGQEAEPHSIPYQVFIEAYTNEHFWNCAGSLISPNYVLASAFCLDYPLEANLVLGAHNPYQDEDTQIRVRTTWNNATLHPDFDRNSFINDICVIGLPYPVEFTDAIQPVPLPKRADVDDTYVGSIARVSGWGPTDGFAEDDPQGLRFLDTEVINKSECEEYYRELPDSNMCTSGKDNTGICFEDAGGPLVQDGVQIGIASFNIYRCLDGYPSGYTKVNSYLDWIEENTDVIIE